MVGARRNQTYKRRELTIMRMLNNASLATKSLLQALMGCVILVAIAALAISSFADYQRADTEQDGAIHVADLGRDAWIDLGRGRAELYRAINLKSQVRDLRSKICEGESASVDRQCQKQAEYDRCIGAADRRRSRYSFGAVDGRLCRYRRAGSVLSGTRRSRVDVINA